MKPTMNIGGGDYLVDTTRSRDIGYPRRGALRKRGRRSPVTVCIAAICQFRDAPTIVGATDHMITAGDIEFEPPKSKIFPLTELTIALLAGDASDQESICQDTLAAINKKTIVLGKEGAEQYAQSFRAHRRKKAELEILSSLGLSLDSFRAQSQQISPEIVRYLRQQLEFYEFDPETIITGVDYLGGHIYIIRDKGHIECNDRIGFAAIGYGARHAESEFMFAKYTPNQLFGRALLVTYSAKKRAEVAPGVGKGTSMFVIGKEGWFYVPKTIVDDLAEKYNNLQTKIADLKSHVASILADIPTPA